VGKGWWFLSNIADWGLALGLWPRLELSLAAVPGFRRRSRLAFYCCSVGVESPGQEVQ